MRSPAAPSSAARARAALAVLALIAGLFALLSRTGSPAATSAASASPPPPPATVPTPIGPPPYPPTMTPRPAATPGPAASATPAPSPTATSALAFTLDAARVSKVNDSGDLRGLTRVKPGSTTWLMMYFTIQHLPRALPRTTTYTILSGNRVVFKVVYRGTARPSDRGRFSRYTVYRLPKAMHPGRYHYRAALTIGKQTRTRWWSFTLGTS